MDFKKKKISFVGKRDRSKSDIIVGFRPVPFTDNFLLKWFVYPNLLASLKHIIKRRIEVIPLKSKVIGVYSTNILPKVKPIIE